jgi:hypothetical protein
MPDPFEALAQELGAAPPPEFERLDPGDLRRLRELLAGRREQQSRDLRDAIDDGLGFVPRLARGAAKRALFG